MTDTRDIVLGGRTFEVPRLPLGVNIKAYPLLRKVNNNGLFERWHAPDGGPTEEDMADIALVGFLCAKAADPALTREEFDALPIAPHELFDTLIVARFQSGAWVEATPSAADGEDAGEAPGEPKPRKSTSAASSQS